ncbi:hypothetical protein [Echinicola sp. 20G]|uniref:hypothetical protein n=1 Tax=Echinicola sp. 20G TaxID=2781961 RepID=UPI0019106375|nr:hypothetical protein [Echinicola sp. 20G]
MKKYILILLTGLSGIFCSCDPRIDMDLAQWGDQAFIQNVQIFEYEVKDDFHLSEYYNNDQETTGIRRVILSGTNVEIDNDNFVVTITVPSLEDLTEAGFLITHRSQLVEPLNGSPKGGVISDLSFGSFMYRLHSADGSLHDWTINLVD